MSQPIHPNARRRDIILAACCGVFVAAMVGLAYASVPFYDWFCRATGFGGRPQIATSAPQRVGARTVSVRFDALGAYAGYDATSPLTTAKGKSQVVAALKLDAPILAVGDGATDLAMRDVVDAFVAFTGFVRRSTVVERADAVASSFADLERVVLLS